MATEEQTPPAAEPQPQPQAQAQGAPPLSPHDYAEAFAAMPPPPDGALRQALAGLKAAVAQFFKRDLRRVVIISVIAFVVGWFINVYIMGILSNGYGKVSPLLPSTPPGGEIGGMVAYLVLSSVVCGLISYRLAVGG